jgi:adenylylsulfate kinase
MLAGAQVIVISGSMGAGKTTVMAEASDVLAHSGRVHAAVDLDTLGIAHLPERASIADVTYANLRSVGANYAAAGVSRLLVAAAVESRGDLERMRDALHAFEIIVCRLRAPLATMEERVRLREPGMYQQEFVGRVANLERRLDAAALEAFTLINDGRPVTDVARELLVRAGWIERALG